MDFSKISQVKNYIVNKKEELVKLHKKIMLTSFSCLTVLASLSVFCVYHSDTKGLTNFLYFVGFSFSTLMAISSLAFFVIGIIGTFKIKNDKIDLGDFKVSLEKNNPFIIPSTYEHYQSIINLMLATTIVVNKHNDKDILFMTDTIEGMNEICIYNKSLLEQKSFDNLPEEIQQKIETNYKALNHNFALMFKCILELNVMDYPDFKTLIENQTIKENFLTLKNIENQIIANEENQHLQQSESIKDLEKVFRETLEKNTLNKEKKKEIKNLSLKL